ncbi:hypothetical protein M1413_02325 [Patescibacteria group bacterium]|jgi:hypothetical protein|nr:hypothetical protein [Patescibacteria group bacterium]
MEKAKMKSGNPPYQCPECGLHYKEKEWAEKCEEWCSEHQSCNLDIIQYAVENDDSNEKRS